MMQLRAFLVVLLAGCSTPVPPLHSNTTDAVKLDNPGLENLFRVTPSLYCGGSPTGEAAFEELKKLGVKTIISVEGGTPDLAAAEKQGMRYVHLPMSYDGLNRQTALKLAKAVQTLPGSIYIHSRHGRHRGPAAVVAVRLSLEPDYTPAAATAWLTRAGTEPVSKKLMKLPTTFKRPSEGELAATPAEFPAKSEISDLATRMLQVDEHCEVIQASQTKNWLGAENAASRLTDDFRETKRILIASTKGVDFAKYLAEAEAAAKDFAAAVKDNRLTDAPALFDKVKASCIKCHSRYRD